MSFQWFSLFCYMFYVAVLLRYVVVLYCDKLFVLLCFVLFRFVSFLFVLFGSVAVTLFCKRLFFSPLSLQCLSFFCETQKKIFWRMFTVHTNKLNEVDKCRLLLLQNKTTLVKTTLDPIDFGQTHFSKYLLLCPTKESTSLTDLNQHENFHY